MDSISSVRVGSRHWVLDNARKSYREMLAECEEEIIKIMEFKEVVNRGHKTLIKLYQKTK